MKFSQLVVVAYGKNQKLATDESRSLRHIVMQRALWTRLQTTFAQNRPEAVFDKDVN
eukprot:m.351806 g.351806  ORF g.351806 m.351806 type:complete len:57 (+) comp16358_c0_seq1:388-558(+)